MSASDNKNRLLWMDLLRTIALVLVYYGHMVIVATYSTSIPEAIADQNSKWLPLIPVETHDMVRLEYFFMDILHSQTAVVGVCLFFTLAGYVTVNAKEKYTSRQFVVNRIARLYPTVFVGTILIALCLNVFQGMVYNWVDVLAQILLITPIVQSRGIILGVTWTLYVEVMFYVVFIIAKRIDFRFIISVNVCVCIGICMLAKINSANLRQIIYYMKYIPIILVGVAIKDSERRNSIVVKIGEVICAVVMAWGNLILNANLNGDPTSYYKIGTCLTTNIIFLLIYFFRNTSVENKIPRVFTYIAGISFPMYLLQVALGFNVMYLIKRYISINSYMIEIVTLSVVVLLSVLIHHLVEIPGQKMIKKYF